MELRHNKLRESHGVNQARWMHFFSSNSSAREPAFTSLRSISLTQLGRFPVASLATQPDQVRRKTETGPILKALAAGGLLGAGAGVASAAAAAATTGAANARLADKPESRNKRATGTRTTCQPEEPKYKHTQTSNSGVTARSRLRLFGKLVCLLGLSMFR